MFNPVDSGKGKIEGAQFVLSPFNLRFGVSKFHNYGDKMEICDGKSHFSGDEFGFFTDNFKFLVLLNFFSYVV